MESCASGCHDAAMDFPSPGHFRTLDDFRSHARGLGLGMQATEATGTGAAWTRPVEVLGRRLANRFCTHPMEGWDGTPEGRPTDLTLRRWRNFGRSGASLVWGGEAFSVTADGRANPNQLHLGANSEADLVALRRTLLSGREEVGVASEPVAIGLQLTHSGRFSRPNGPLAPRIAHHHALLARKYRLDPSTALLTDGELEAIGERMVQAARLAHRAGFDFVDVKCCHGYLLHEVLASHTRNGTYGGSFDNRTRLFTRIVEAIRAECPGLGLGVRLSAGDVLPFEADPATNVGRPMAADGFDGARHHFAFGTTPATMDRGEAVRFATHAHSLGVTLLNVTLGSPYWNPHLQRPAVYPPSDGYLPPVDPLTMVQVHLDTTAALKAACPGLHVVGTGYTYLQEWLPHVAQAELDAGRVDFVGLGRLLLSYPELPADLCAGRELQRKRICRTFSDCTTGPRNGMVSGCFPLDPFYKARPEAAKVKAIRQGMAP
ncbi:MAG: dehydrogenase [Planctomycetota bacterium]|jgi:2,4-dienoyl-CoA reductase-like NADH-dependent reductase (Old Yellow Enzyme family)